MTADTAERYVAFNLFDVLLPGDADWPSASAAIANGDKVLADLTQADRQWVEDAAAKLVTLATEDRIAAVTRLEQEAPDPFNRVLHALYDAYYNTPAAHAQVARLAEAGPREASRFFDVSLLDQVIATQAGKRRL